MKKKADVTLTGLRECPFEGCKVLVPRGGASGYAGVGRQLVGKGKGRKYRFTASAETISRMDHDLAATVHRQHLERAQRVAAGWVTCPKNANRKAQARPALEAGSYSEKCVQEYTDLGTAGVLVAAAHLLKEYGEEWQRQGAARDEATGKDWTLTYEGHLLHMLDALGVPAGAPGDTFFAEKVRECSPGSPQLAALTALSHRCVCIEQMEYDPGVVRRVAALRVAGFQLAAGPAGSWVVRLATIAAADACEC